MFNKLIVGYLVLITLLSTTPLCAKEFKLTNKINIVLPENGSKVDEFAAQELKKHFVLAGATDCNIVRNSNKEKTSDSTLTFYIGKSPADFKGKLENAEARYSIQNNKVYFWGENRFTSRLPLEKTLRGSNTRCGTLSAVYSFLFNKLGIKWLRPGDSGIHCPKRLTVNLPDKEIYKWTMPMNMCGVRVYWWRNRLIQPLTRFTPKKLQCSPADVNEHSDQDIIWFRRMRLGNKKRISYGHAFGKWWDKYGKDHPEWFGMNPNGKRGLSERLKSRNKLCLSNNQVVEQIIKEWQQKGSPEYWNICPNDGSLGYCRCDKCMLLDCRKDGETFYDHLTDRYVNFWNRIVAKAVKIRPDVKFITYIYSYYRHPPRREKIEYPDNMVLGMVPMMFENNEELFEKWLKAGAKNVFLRPNDLCVSSPFFMGLEKRIYDKFQTSRKFKLFGTDYDGSCGVRTIDFAYYISARMIIDQGKSFDELEDEYCSAYGTAAPAVKEFYKYYRRLGEENLLKVKNNLKNRQLLDSSQLIPEILRNISSYYSLKNFRDAEAILNKAKKLNLDNESSRRLQELYILNKHAMKTYKFLVEAQKKQQGKSNDIDKYAKELVEFREKNAQIIDWCWQYLFGRTEREYWQLSDWYLKSIDLKINKTSKMLLWSSFDLPAMDGWRKRDRFSKLTDRTASFDKFSVELAATSKPGLGISYHAFRVVPGKTYELSYDFLLSPENSPEYLRLRTVGYGQKIKNKTMFNIYSRKKNKFWQTEKKTFRIPAEITSITLYFVVGPGEKDKVVNIDNISCRIIDNSK